MEHSLLPSLNSRMGSSLIFPFPAHSLFPISAHNTIQLIAYFSYPHTTHILYSSQLISPEHQNPPLNLCFNLFMQWWGINSWPSRGDIYMYKFMKRYLTEHVFTVCANIKHQSTYRKNTYIRLIYLYGRISNCTSCHQLSDVNASRDSKIYPSGYRATNLTEIVRTEFNKSTITLANDSANKLIKNVLTPARLENSAT